jgi:antitoxin component of MazEF toxin-antitoxin module
MWSVKVRKVGNSNVITLPKELAAEGWLPGCRVLVSEENGIARLTLLAPRADHTLRDALLRDTDEEGGQG